MIFAARQPNSKKRKAAFFGRFAIVKKHKGERLRVSVVSLSGETICACRPAARSRVLFLYRKAEAEARVPLRLFSCTGRYLHSQCKVKDADLSDGAVVTAVAAFPRFFSSETYLAALKANGAVVIWRVSEGLYTRNQHLYSNVKQICANRASMAALKEDGAVTIWGEDFGGGDGVLVKSQLSDGVARVYAHPESDAMLALKVDGAVVAWGAASDGGDISSVQTQLSAGVANIYTSSCAAAALKKDGALVTWGDVAWGGDSSSVRTQLSAGVKHVTGCICAMAALKTDGGVVTWGEASCGGDSSSVQAQLTHGVTRICSMWGNMAALKEDGAVVTWGEDGQNSKVRSRLSEGVLSIHTNGRSMAAMKEDGSVVTWGDSRCGGNSDDVQMQISQGVTDIHMKEGARAMAATKKDGGIVTWGHSRRGGDSSVLRGQLSAGVIQLRSTSRGMSALKADGTLLTWGLDAENSENERMQQVVYSDTCGDITVNWKRDGAVTFWGCMSPSRSSRLAMELQSGVSSLRRIKAPMTR